MVTCLASSAPRVGFWRRARGARGQARRLQPRPRPPRGVRPRSSRQAIDNCSLHTAQFYGRTMYFCRWSGISLARFLDSSHFLRKRMEGVSDRGWCGAPDGEGGGKRGAPAEAVAGGRARPLTERRGGSGTCENGKARGKFEVRQHRSSNGACPLSIPPTRTYL